MGRFIDLQTLVATVGEDELLQIAGSGDWNSAEGRVIDEAIVARAVAYADALIAGYVLARNPWVSGIENISDVPDLLSGVATDIVRYRLRNQSGAHGEMTDTVKDRYQAAMATLRDLSAGKIDLSDPRTGSLDPVTPATDLIRHEGGGRTAAPLVEDFLR